MIRHVSAWCRACGVPQTHQSQGCSSCGTDLAIGAPDPTPVGLVFETKGRLGMGKKQAVCLTAEGADVVLHVSPRDKEPVRLPNSTPPIDLIPADLGPASRLMMAADLEGAMAWDRDLLRTRAAELCADVRVLRQVVDDALRLGWDHIVTWAPLTESEKAWRTAHHASTTGDLDALLAAMTRLPASGYSHRAELLLPHVCAIHHDVATWFDVLQACVTAGAGHASAVLALVSGTWDAAIDGGATLVNPQRSSAWSAWKSQLANAADLSTPPFTDTPAWTAASLVGAADRSQTLDSALAHLTGLEPALWDDLLDQGRITLRAPLSSLTGGLRSYVLARLDPARLTDAETARVGHTGELARRYFLARDRATLSGLEPERRVVHYQALLDVVESGTIDVERLDPATAERLRAPAAALAAIKSGSASQLPPPVAADASLWPMFADLAIAGKLAPDPGRPAGDPLNTWIGLLRLVGLVWEGKLAEAVQHGNVLIPQLAVERAQDEALNLLAFALDQLGQPDQALAKLDDALKGEYTENLLVNASIVASGSRPETGVRYLTRLVEEAPTPELQRAAVKQAVDVWTVTDLPFPQVLAPALRTVLSGPLPVREYLDLGGTAALFAPDVVRKLPDLGGELTAPRRILVARARLKDNDFFLADLASEFIAVYRSVGRTEWFDKEWSIWVDAAHDGVFTDFGEALGSADFIDHVIMNAPELFTPHERFVMSPQAGAHLSASFALKGGWLNDTAMNKFLFRPIDEFMAKRSEFKPDQVEYLAANFTLCLGTVGIHMLGAGRDDVAADYNPLVERLRWDHQNSYQILRQLENILINAENNILATLDRLTAQMRRLGSNERADLTRAVISDVSDWRDEINRLRRNL